MDRCERLVLLAGLAFALGLPSGPGLAATAPLAPIPAATASPEADIGRIVGFVREGDRGGGIAGVSIRLEGPDERTAITDRDGAFRFELLPEGTYTIRADHLAYEAVEVEVDVAGDDRTTRVEIRLLPGTIAVAPLVVQVEGRRPTFGPLVQVYERIDRQRRMGLGTILTRDDIERRVGGRVTDLMQGMAGVRVIPGPEGTTIQMRRAVSLRGCPVQIYLDGIKVGTGSPDDYVIPTELEILEVYRGGSQVPPEFSGSDAQCGVVAMWTRRGI